jgi:hypothetical protein
LEQDLEHQDAQEESGKKGKEQDQEKVTEKIGGRERQYCRGPRVASPPQIVTEGQPGYETGAAGSAASQAGYLEHRVAGPPVKKVSDRVHAVDGQQVTGRHDLGVFCVLENLPGFPRNLSPSTITSPRESTMRALPFTAKPSNIE